MLTTCPHCQTRFRVPESLRRAASGRVRCGVC
ncbi:MAG: MJ0042-type zinc finger domain-containing protein [Steroidobacteraceae bacterium]